MAGPYYSESSATHLRPAAASVYPGMLPPPVPYPSGSRWRLIAVILLVVAILGGATTAVVHALTSDKHAAAAADGTLTEASAKAAIQDYLDAMEQNDTETVARNTLCGFYDDIKDKRSEQALARLNSDTFRKQFTQADVTSVDKMVSLAPSQAQVLFSMQVVPATRGAKKREEQAVATLVADGDQVLVCQYVLKSGGQY